MDLDNWIKVDINISLNVKNNIYLQNQNSPQRRRLNPLHLPRNHFHSHLPTLLSQIHFPSPTPQNHPLPHQLPTQSLQHPRKNLQRQLATTTRLRLGTSQIPNAWTHPHFGTGNCFSVRRVVYCSLDANNADQQLRQQENNCKVGL